MQRRLDIYILLLASALFLHTRSSHAQGVIYNTPAGPIRTEVVGPFSEHRPGSNAWIPNASTQAPTSGGVTSGISGTAQVKVGGKTVPVPTTVKANIPNIAISTAGAAVLTKFLPGVGLALTVGQIVSMLLPDRHRCADNSMGYFCETPSSFVWNKGGVDYPSPEAACAASGFIVYERNPTTAMCGIEREDGTKAPVYVNVFAMCHDGQPPQNGACNGVISGVEGPVPADKLAGEINDKLSSNPGAAKSLADAIIEARRTEAASDPSKAGTLNSDLINHNTPLTLDAQPVTTNPEVVSTANITNPDGTTSIREVTQQTTVTPTMSPGATPTQQPIVSYPTTVTTTVRNTNTTTNVTTTNTYTNNYDPTAAPAPAQKSCGASDDKCHVIVDETGTPNGDEAAAANQQAKQTLQTELDKARDINEGVADDKFQWNFIPQIPVAECSNPSVSLMGVTREIEICKWFNILKRFISGVIAFFCLIATVRHVESALKG